MRARDEWKIAFKTRDGPYKWMVKPFGHPNAPSTFMHLMNHIFKPFIGSFVVAYFYDIFVICQLKKCHFLTDTLVFLGYVVSEKRYQDGSLQDEGDHKLAHSNIYT